jgi:hypothetical protein
MTASTWKLQAAAHVAARDARFPAELQLPQDLQCQSDRLLDLVALGSLLTPREEEITVSSSSTILQKLANRAWSAVEVTKVSPSLFFLVGSPSDLVVEATFNPRSLPRPSPLEQLLHISSLIA